ncbi:hypothetical protein B0J17DRAFT_207781 [Rhizoctonia solani]|nr:hypothetical protein B0J17DRAFT_207781 [Rhizoctonia solani]
MLAKDWCHSFRANRTGHPQDQALRRQRKWKLIERWRMRELLELLPMLVHLSLLLFVIGLCVYLWDLNTTTAIPVVCVSGTVAVFYILSSIMAGIVEHFPYTTIISRILRSAFVKKLILTALFLWIFIIVLSFICSFVVMFFFPIFSLFLSSLPLIVLFLLIAGLKRYYFKSAVLTQSQIDILGLPIFAIVGFNIRLFGIMVGFWNSPPRLFSSIMGGFRRLELNNDLVTSLALSWLIQHCETQSAVDIALQAIAGASQRIPREPLSSSEATVQILRRVVLHSTDEQAEPINKLYTRGLEFLGSHPLIGTTAERNKNMEDINVMVWDLKSENDRQMADIVKDSSFTPTAENLQSMRIGHAAPSHSLRSLRGDSQSAAVALRSITTLLARHVESQNKALHPAAVQSLVNAATLHASFLSVTELPPDLVVHCMGYFYHLSRDTPRNIVLAGKLGPAAVLVICALMYCRPNTNEPSLLVLAQP